MKIFLTFFLIALIFVIVSGAENGIENKEIKGVQAETPLGRHRRYGGGWGWGGGYGGWGGGYGGWGGGYGGWGGGYGGYGGWGGGCCG
ncbi:hypothetical protein ACQ4LE_001274 [Meloidogyne hapla]